MPRAERRSRALVWGASLAALAAATALMLAFRADLDKAHFALVYLLIVLGGSAAGGRALGLTIAGLAFLAFDYLFLPPYYTLIIANPLDWFVLVTFLVSSVIAAQLLTRAQERAAEARRRTEEVERLAALGAETLNAGSAEDSLAAIASVIRATLGVERCEVYAREGAAAGLRPVARAGGDGTDGGDGTVGATSLVAWVAEHGAPATESMDGTARVSAGAGAPAWPDLAGVRVLVAPLRVRDRTVGVLRVESPRGIALAPGQREFLSALEYYAALGVERLRLAAEAEHSAALREADRLKGALLAAVSHDLRTPLTTIKALAHGIGADGAAPGDARAASIEEEADRLARVVGDLLELSKLAGGALQFRLELNTADDLLGAVLQRVAGIAAGRELRVSTEPAGALLVGRFDLVHALRALGNLVENAIKYSPPSSAIDLSARQDGDTLAFTVADRGPGVPERERERIFDPFYRPPNVPPDVGGTGLGLTIARGLAEAQGGTVTCRPRAGGGSIFELRLPAAERRPA
ncbi:MAG TPA: ATP-binding protein [Gemmatimonadaceae bacterium]|nr:ATP-binding protein [Gemmatimonadaceae bacterium]